LKRLSEQKSLALFFDVSTVQKGFSDFLHKVKRSYPDLKIIALLEEAQKNQTVQLLRTGAWTCLGLPILAEELAFYLNKIITERQEAYNPFAVRFDERTIVIPNDFSIIMQVVKNLVYNSLPADKKNRYQVIIGLSEIVSNAIEHGNLGITSQEKNAALKAYAFFNLALERAAREPYKSRVVTLKSKVYPQAQKVEYAVWDEGAGFDWRQLPDPRDKVNILKGSGRGITIAKIVFDEVIFNQKGNRVILVYRTDKDSA
jgi:anti-sigma regulatory factor (Ser/Thr protein kinase)